MRATKENAEAIMAFCAYRYVTTVERMLDRKRDFNTCYARMVAIQVCRELMPSNRIVIAGFFHRSESAVSYSEGKCRGRLMFDEKMKQVYQEAMGYFGSLKEGNLRKVVIEVMCGEVVVKSKPPDVDVVVVKPYPTIKL